MLRGGINAFSWRDGCNGVQRFAIGRAPRRKTGARRHRIIDGKPCAFARAGLVGMTRKVWKCLRRVAVQGHKQNVVARLNDILGAIAMVKVHIEDRDTRCAFVQQRQRRC